ncbi:MAG TPA: ribonuclease D [Leptospiraceae bacterium]|nr:ribonuclease D [Leptospiraceae bacterium]HMY67829.1 ribonuclease D [Leptospiraceae bacterium]HMZ61931.1 ribonuclease D [Leptospiraceae bacterium]HNF14654.1 ribonuclease D [Leptospiraceae bacterium]HNF25329.1 ribonuclease D [Leptospiraceae bacterium]
MPQKQSSIKPKVFTGDLDQEFLEMYLSDDRLAVDCEMMGLNPRRDRLCVIQMNDSRNHYSLVQILPDQKTAPNLKRLLEHSETVKIFHYARMDLCFLESKLGIRTNPVFCTKIASKLSRTYTDKHGLKDNIREFFGENMDKKNQSSDWGKKNLSRDQVEYACEDVKYLISLMHIQTEMLIREGRMELAEKCFAALPVIVSLDLLELQGVFEH